jgi:cell wall-associated NlpC family hydrolase
MADPATIALVVKAAVAAATDKRTWKALGVIIAAILTPFILVIVMITSLLSGTADHNNTAVGLSFHGGVISGQVPADYRQYIEDMRAAFEELDAAISEITPMMEDESLDTTQVKAIFYSLYFGADSLRGIDYRVFVDCFVRYEERTRTVVDEDGNETEETYTVAVPLTSLPQIYASLESSLNQEITYENQANASEIYYRAQYGTGAPGEGDGFDQWSDWTPEQLVDVIHDLPVGETGSKAVQLALERLGDPYSQELRGQGNYTDCSYLVQSVYRQLKITLPGTAAEQGRYCVSNGLTISKSNLAPGDLVFWSHKVNGRYRNITHVGIYAGNGMVVDASSSKGKVVYRNLFDADKQVLYARPYAAKTK